MAATARLASLSDREREVAVAVAAGAPNADIAAQPYLSEATVKAYVSRLLVKLDAANRGTDRDPGPRRRLGVNREEGVLRGEYHTALRSKRGGRRGDDAAAAFRQ